MAKYVFISYGHDGGIGSKSAELIYNHLRQDEDNLIVWWDKKIEPSYDWLKDIDNHLNELINRKPDSYFVFVATPYSVSTERENFCINEIVKAVGGKVKVIPVKVSETPMPLLLCNKQWLDFSNICIDKTNKDFVGRMEELHRIIQEGIEMPRDGKQEMLRVLLEPSDFLLDLDKHLKDYEPRSWLLEEVKTWIKDSQENILLLLGGPGTGKTAFSVWMSYCELSDLVGAWHLCQYNDKRTCSLRNAVKSIAYYLAARIPAYRELLDVVELEKILSQCDFDAGTLFKAMILEKIKRIEHDSTVAILIDALDEAGGNGHNELAEMLARYSSEFPCWLKIIITGRNDPSLTTHLHDCSKIINLDDPSSSPRVSEDVKRYVARILKDNRDIVPKVFAESGSNFLYAKLLCESIRCGQDINQYQLPKGINSYYNDYLRRYLRNDKIDYDTQVRPLLNLILIAYEPLKKNHLFRRVKATCKWCNKRSDFDRLIKGLGPLLKELDGTILPFHKSFADWLSCESNHSYHVYREDGLEDIIDWGMEVVCMDGIDWVDDQVHHFFAYLPQYMIEAMDTEKIRRLYADLDFWKRRSRVLGVNRTLRLMIEEIESCSPTLRKSIFMQDGFHAVLEYFNIDLFNTGRFVHLHKLGYEMPIQSGMDDNRRLLSIRYLYINELYETIDDKIDVFEERYDDPVVEAMLMNELGQTYRKLGLLSRSANYYERSLNGAIKHGGTWDEVIYTMLNLSRIYTLLCRDADARRMLGNAWELYGTGKWKDSMQGADFEFSAQQLARGMYYVALETENFSLIGDERVCEKSLEWADEVYSDPLRRDRYYANHLIGKMFHMLRMGQDAEIGKYIEECEKNLPGAYDGFRLAIIKVLADLKRGNIMSAMSTAKEKLDILCSMSIHMIQRTEIAVLVDYITGESQKESICEEFHPWYDHFYKLINSIFPSAK